MGRGCGYRWSQQGLEELIVSGEILMLPQHYFVVRWAVSYSGRSNGSLVTWTPGPFLVLTVELLSL